MSAVRHYEMFGDHYKDVRGYEDYRASTLTTSEDPIERLKRAFLAHPWGTPEHVLEDITNIGEKFGASEFMVIARFGGMPYDKAYKSMQLFADKVMPELRKRKFAPLTPESVDAGEAADAARTKSVG
jgi:hypothetical protein